MPSFTDYLFAPWKLFGSFTSSGPTSPVIVGTAPPLTQNAMPPPLPDGPFCSYQDVGGQMLHICRVAGYAMPSFVFFASFLILVLFATASGALLLQCLHTARAMSRASKALAKLSHRTGVPLTRHELEAIRELMSREKGIAPAWSQFEETLLIVKDKDQEKEEVYSTVAIESVFSKAALIEENIHGAFFGAVPGILTGVGLLMTFVAILDGLSHVSVAANMDVQGIGGLINGLSGKFVSSIVAVTCAVAFIFVERVAYGRPQAAYRKLVKALSLRFKRRTAEYLLQEIQVQLNATLGRIEQGLDLAEPGSRR